MDWCGRICFNSFAYTDYVKFKGAIRGRRHGFFVSNWTGWHKFIDLVHQGVTRRCFTMIEKGTAFVSLGKIFTTLAVNFHKLYALFIYNSWFNPNVYLLHRKENLHFGFAAKKTEANQKCQFILGHYKRSTIQLFGCSLLTIDERYENEFR